MTYLEYAKNRIDSFSSLVQQRGLSIQMLEMKPDFFWIMFMAAFCPWELELCEKRQDMTECNYECESCWKKEMEEMI